MRGRLYDLATAPTERAGFARLRRRLLGHASGRVLEVGAGTGRNIQHYPTDGSVTSVDLTEPDAVMRRRLDARVGARAPGQPPTLSVHDVGAHGPFPGGPYETIVCTLVLCTVPQPERAVEAMVEALAEGGRLIYVEHVRSPGRAAARFQHAVEPLWARAADGCSVTRETHAMLRSAGLVTVEQEVIRMPPPLFLAFAGVAIRRIRPEAAA